MTARPAADHSVTSGSVTESGCTAARAIARLRFIRDELELAGRAPGEIVTIHRQTLDSILNEIGVVSCAIRETAER